MPRSVPLARLAAVCLALLTVLPAPPRPPSSAASNFEVWQTWTARDAFLAPEFDRNSFPDWMGTHRRSSARQPEGRGLRLRPPQLRRRRHCSGPATTAPVR